ERAGGNARARRQPGQRARLPTLAPSPPGGCGRLAPTGSRRRDADASQTVGRLVRSPGARPQLARRLRRTLGLAPGPGYRGGSPRAIVAEGLKIKSRPAGRLT